MAATKSLLESARTGVTPANSLLERVLGLACFYKQIILGFKMGYYYMIHIFTVKQF